MAKKTKIGSGIIFFATLFSIVIGAAACSFGSIYFNKPDSYEIPDKVDVEKLEPSIVGGDFTVETIKSNEFSIHFMELGNKFTGDSTLIKAGDVEVLIDAGSKTTSVQTIYNYASSYIEGVLDYIIVTHAHEDHYAGFATQNYNDSLFAKFNVGAGTKIIDFSMITSNKANNTMYKNYVRNRAKAIENNAEHYTCKELVDADNAVINLTSDVTMTILKTKFYNQMSSTENNHSVCTLFSNNEHHYLLTGDLEKEGETSLASMNSLPKVDVYKAGHHGSKTSSSAELISIIQPKEVCVCCCAGSSEYTKNNLNQFPTQEFINHVAPYTDKIFVTSLCLDYDNGAYTSMNGNIIVCSNKNEPSISTYCTNNSTILKETDWFKTNRTWPSIAS